MSDAMAERWARWCFETCLLNGCDAALAARVTAIFTASALSRNLPPHEGG